MFEKGIDMDHGRQEYLKLMQSLNKSDLHSHAGRGGNKKFIEEFYGVEINNPPARFSSLKSMQEWYADNIRGITKGKLGYIKRWEAAFRQAHEDEIAVLSLSFGTDEIAYVGGMETFIKILSEMSQKYAPNTDFLPEVS